MQQRPEHAAKYTEISAHLILRSYDYNMHVEGLLSANLCLLTLLIKLGTMFVIDLRTITAEYMCGDLDFYNYSRQEYVLYNY